MTALTDDELEHLQNFVGYGRLDAAVWFLGMEEAGGGEANIRTRLKFKPVEDCAEAHRMLGFTKHHEGKKIIQRTWRGMCCIMLRLAGQAITTESIRQYQADYLGRFGGNSLLCELMPIPKPRIQDWGYEGLIPQFASSAEYYQTVKPRRIRYLQGLIKEHRPQVVVGYGRSYWEAYRALFPQMTFSQKGPFMAGRDADTAVVLTDHFTARTMNGQFDEVVLLIKSLL